MLRWGAFDWRVRSSPCVSRGPCLPALELSRGAAHGATCASSQRTHSRNGPREMPGLYSHAPPDNRNWTPAAHFNKRWLCPIAYADGLHAFRPASQLLEISAQPRWAEYRRFQIATLWAVSGAAQWGPGSTRWPRVGRADCTTVAKYIGVPRHREIGLTAR